MSKNVYKNNTILIENLKQGKEGAFIYLMDVFYTKLCVYAETLTNDSYQAEDIVQNVFIKIWSKRDTLKDDFSINNFLYKLVYNEFINQYRKNKLFTPLEEENIKQLNYITDENNEPEVLKIIKFINKEIKNLPPKCKAVFTMSKKEGLTYIEIANHLGVSISTVEMHMSNAFKIIRKKLKTKKEFITFLVFVNNSSL